jgi:hypothetical protein
MSNPKKQIVIGPCAYCGEERELEPEHVVPRSIFVHRNQAKIVVPACRACNNAKADGEDDLRDYLIITVGIHGHPEIWELMRQRMKPAAQKGYSKIAKALMTQRRPTFYETNAGLLIPGYEAPLYDPLASDRTLRWMVRGLYFQDIGIPWKENQPLSLVTIDMEEVAPTIELFREWNPDTSRKPLGNNIFCYLPVVADDLETIAWLMVFFGKAAYVGFTGIPEENGYFELPLSQRLQQNSAKWKKLKKIVEGGLVVVPPDDFLGALSAFHARNPNWPKN